MNVRDGSFDVVIVAAPRVSHWPTAGARLLSQNCSQMGLEVGMFGGDIVRVRGVIPLPATGGLVLAEDAQGRVHRIVARAVVKFAPVSEMPDPFPGWWSEGLLPLSTARTLLKGAPSEGMFSWSPATAILGTGNAALRFGSRLLESGVPEVYAVESHVEWGAKRFSGWEVERRRFEILGGRMIEAKPVSITQKAPLLWELRLEDTHGIRILEVTRVVSAGPFGPTQGIREHPPGSSLFQIDQTAHAIRLEDIEGWIFEEERARLLAGRLTKRLMLGLDEPGRESLEKFYKKARIRLRRYARHLAQPFTPGYQGKWIAPQDAKFIRSYVGVPQLLLGTKPLASIECFEEIACNACEKACPESAIDFSRKGKSLIESACTACGICVEVCPSAAIPILRVQEDRSLSKVTLPWRGSRSWAVGEQASLLNRRGETLASGRVTAVFSSETNGVQRVELDVPTHLVWEARGLRRPRTDGSTSDAEFLRASARTLEARIEVTLNGERRLLRDRISVGIALFESGRGRPEDALLCADGSCGLCQVQIDGVNKLACQTLTRPRMNLKLPQPESEKTPRGTEDLLCPCLGITRSQVVDKVRQAKLRSPEAAVSFTHVGSGKCHGQVCGEAFRRVLVEEGIPAQDWIDWRFPWSEWKIASGKTE